MQASSQLRTYLRLQVCGIQGGWLVDEEFRVSALPANGSSQRRALRLLEDHRLGMGIDAQPDILIGAANYANALNHLTMAAFGALL